MGVAAACAPRFGHPASPRAGFASIPPSRFDSISIISDSDSIPPGSPIWAPIASWRRTGLPTSADSTLPDPAADCRRSEAFRSP
eukprot:9471078-Pyramimonas_sp.AAC.1